MRSTSMKFWLLLAVVIVASWSPSSARAVAVTGQGPSLRSIGPLAFSADGTLFVADNQGAAIFALDVDAQGTVAGAKAVDGLDQKLAAMLGTAASEITITDLAVHPKTHNAFVSVMRGQGAGTAPALFRIDGAGKIENVSLGTMRFSKVDLPNPPAAVPATGRTSRANTITDMAFADGRLWVAGLSNEEFASNLRAVPYPFSTVDRGTSVEIYHGNHAQVETRSPVYTFIPYRLGGEPYLIAGYTCTPLVKFPIANLKPGQKVRGVTIADLGAGNRPLDMVLYRKDGKEFLLMSNNSRGVMKIPTDRIAAATPIVAPVQTETAGVPYETISTMKQIEQLDLLDAQSSIVIARGAGALDLKVVALP